MNGLAFEVVENPRTLKQSFCFLEEACLDIDLHEHRTFLFKFAYRIAEIEGVDASRNNGFLNFVRHNYFHKKVEEMIQYGIDIYAANQIEIPFNLDQMDLDQPDLDLPSDQIVVDFPSEEDLSGYSPPNMGLIMNSYIKQKKKFDNGYTWNAFKKAVLNGKYIFVFE